MIRQRIVFSQFNSSFDDTSSQPDTVISNKSTQIISNNECSRLSERISRDEKIINYFCRLIQLTCGIVSFKEDVDSIDIPGTLRLPVYWRHVATAIEFFKRFYLNNSLLHFDPRIIMYLN